ncbi:DMT family transporter [Pedobacter puniceum]|jgi:drug/metabolite transporter (DMT)-like permease|uniref:EamA family transporter n=1 Tax=Pedobacter puniceum TaxID=2666136 RepID=A0A7K0FJ38_9SPHI|nr:DMT family transporter [Pedobacter puniceum]MRX45994.1 EamA family transporter [Pedobacter puniceum]
MKIKLNNVLILHLTVFVWGFTAILGALISINETHLTWYRVLIAFSSLYLWFKYKKIDFRVNKEQFLKLFLTGGIVGLHWILFFGSIKASTVSVAMVCLSSLTLFTAVLEPLFSSKSVSKLEILVGFLIILGIYMIFKFETEYETGIIMGISSAFCASIFSIINSKQVKNRAATVITYYELIGAFCWISFYLLLTNGYTKAMILNLSDIIYLLILGIICTSVAYVAGVMVMKELSAFRVALITNLEPVYAIILALFIFGKDEQMTNGFYAGASIILATIFLYPIVKTRLEKRKLSKNLHP